MQFSKVGIESKNFDFHYQEIKKVFDLFCPCCNKRLDGLGVVTQEEEKGEIQGPEENSVTVCSSCFELLIFKIDDTSKKLVLKKPDEKDLDEIKKDENLNYLIEQTNFLIKKVFEK